MQENFHGSQQKVNVLEGNMLKAKDNQEKYSEHSPKIIPSLKRRLNSPLPLPEISQTPNGNELLGENLSTSTTSLAHSTTLPLLKRALDVLEELRLKYLCHNFWSEEDHTLDIVDWTEFAPPLPCPPQREFNNVKAQKTISYSNS